MQLCLKCRRPLPERQGTTGRPPAYCSVSCRRAAEFEIGRVNRLIENLEETLSRLRCDRVSAFLHDIPALETELTLQRQRLLELLDEPDEGDEMSETLTG
jgi:hypothetical protein